MGKKTLRKDARFLFEKIVIEGPPLIPMASPPAPPPEIDGLMIRAYVKTIDWFPWPIRPLLNPYFWRG